MTARPKQSSPAVKAGVYTRISSDPSGERAGVERQRADCEAHCKARGWEVVDVFCDNDASAYGRKPRLAYERMLAAVESGSIDAIVTSQRPPAPLSRGARSVHRSRRAQGRPPGRGHWRGLRPHDPGRAAVSADRRSRRPQGVRGQEPTRPAQAPGARRARQARRPAGLGRAQVPLRPRRSIQTGTRYVSPCIP